MPIMYHWTPAKGWSPAKETGTKYQDLVIRMLMAHVRDAAYNVCQLEASGNKCQEYSRAVTLWRDIVRTYRAASNDMAEVDRFLASTYKPKAALID